jgi:hypothetical protein
MNPPAADFDPLHCSGDGETTPKEQRRQAETALNSEALRLNGSGPKQR